MLSEARQQPAELQPSDQLNNLEAGAGRLLHGAACARVKSAAAKARALNIEDARNGT